MFIKICSLTCALFLDAPLSMSHLPLDTIGPNMNLCTIEIRCLDYVLSVTSNRQTLNCFSNMSLRLMQIYPELTFKRLPNGYLAKGVHSVCQTPPFQIDSSSPTLENTCEKLHMQLFQYLS